MFPIIINNLFLKRTSMLCNKWKQNGPDLFMPLKGSLKTNWIKLTGYRRYIHLWICFFCRKWTRLMRIHKQEAILRILLIFSRNGFWYCKQHSQSSQDWVCGIIVFDFCNSSYSICYCVELPNFVPCRLNSKSQNRELSSKMYIIGNKVSCVFGTLLLFARVDNKL